MTDWPESRRTTARLSAIIARDRRKAVVFRRGPTKSVLVLAWDLKSDTLEAGQWLNGKIYERRCDLSPDGELLVYFAGYRPPLGTWTAVSRPPYLTALALWPKGNAWGGGGLFLDARTLRLNHCISAHERSPAEEMMLAPGFQLPFGFEVQPLGDRSGWGEDEPIYTARQQRDGWRTIGEETEATLHKRGSKLLFSFDPPNVVEKPTRPKGATLRLSLHGIGERNGPWYRQSGAIVNRSGKLLRDLGWIDWADVDHNGDVLYASEGRLHRIRARGSVTEPRLEAVLVADLNDRKFQRVAAPDSALSWPKLKPARRASRSAVSKIMPETSGTQNRD